MAEEEKQVSGISRRKFLKDAGMVVGGATVGSVAILSACSGGETVTKTATVTTTINGAGSTITVTQPPTTKVVETQVDPRPVFKVNGADYKVEIEPYWTLSHVLKESLGLVFLKIGCDRGECGHCTVLVDGMPIYSCLMLASDAVGKTIETAESLSMDKMNYHPIAQAFKEEMAYQCGFCTSGFMMATKALLAETPKPTMAQVQEGLAGHMCVCSAIKRVCETVVKLGGS
jgi:aerobic-type carbon monoxide dehydrogenase small subunit (CoxS/CutS family)